ncbi:MAG: hypothetical protein E6J34_23895 [Chloroflexi bacterium]|nr:MAG: hypothetical protein E6J34_23895 [Chloroflexota bacterium]
MRILTPSIQSSSFSDWRHVAILSSGTPVSRCSSYIQSWHQPLWKHSNAVQVTLPKISQLPRLPLSTYSTGGSSG